MCKIMLIPISSYNYADPPPPQHAVLATSTPPLSPSALAVVADFLLLRLTPSLPVVGGLSGRASLLEGALMVSLDPRSVSSVKRRAARGEGLAKGSTTNPLRQVTEESREA